MDIVFVYRNTDIFSQDLWANRECSGSAGKLCNSCSGWPASCRAQDLVPVTCNILSSSLVGLPGRKCFFPIEIAAVQGSRLRSTHTTTQGHVVLAFT